jgi:hypothetical protein
MLHASEERRVNSINAPNLSREEKEVHLRKERE